MARRSESKEFLTCEGPVMITVTALGGNEAGLLSAKLLNLIGPTMVGMASADDSKMVVDLASQLTAKITAAEFESIKTQLLKGAQAQVGDQFEDVDRGFIDRYFAGEPGALFALIAFALKVNFKTFLPGLGIPLELIAKLTAKAKARAVKSLEEPAQPVQPAQPPAPSA